VYQKKFVIIPFLVVLLLLTSTSASMALSTRYSTSQVNTPQNTEMNDNTGRQNIDRSNPSLDHQLSDRKITSGHETLITVESHLADSSLSDQSALQPQASPSAFVTKWNTEVTGSVGASPSNQIALPLVSGGTYNFDVDWGDGSSSRITSYNQPEVNHTYTTPGIYPVVINGTITGWQFAGSGDKDKLLEIAQWGNLRLTDTGGYFQGAENLVITASDALNLTGIYRMDSAFKNCNNLGTTGNFNSWKYSDIFHLFDH